MINPQCLHEPTSQLWLCVCVGVSHRIRPHGLGRDRSAAAAAWTACLTKRVLIIRIGQNPARCVEVAFHRLVGSRVAVETRLFQTECTRPGWKNSCKPASVAASTAGSPETWPGNDSFLLGALAIGTISQLLIPKSTTVYNDHASTGSLQHVVSLPTPLFFPMHLYGFL